MSSSLHRQSDVIRRKIEGENVEELEEVNTFRRKLEEEQAVRKEAEKSASKFKELEKELKAHEKELNAFVSHSREVMERYHDCLSSMGADTEFPEDCTLEEFMVCLCGEMDTLDGHMMLGREFDAITAFVK